MLTSVPPLEQGRQAIRKAAWADAFSHLSRADQERSLDPEDLQSLSMAAHLLGNEVQSTSALSRAHQGFLARGDKLAAARCACWLSFTAIFSGDLAQSSGWLARARRLLEEQPNCVEQGYVLMPMGLRAIREGDIAGALAAFQQAVEIGQQFGDKELSSLAMQGQGRAFIRQGEIAKGVALLDEAMVAVTAGEVSPIMAGGIYCSVIEACGEIFDLRRAQEWTSALERWCSTQSDVVPYRGHCLIRRAEILQTRGAWADALQEAASACERLSHPVQKPAVGPAFYRKAEMHRLRGEFALAEESYRQAGQWDRIPRPGMALLRLAQGQVASAYTAIRQAAEEVQEPSRRSQVLDAFVEIALAAEDIAAARTAANELAGIATRIGAEFLAGLSARAHGAVLLAEQDPQAAAISLRQALNCFHQLEAPYEVARTQCLLGLAYRALGNIESAEMELGAAWDIYKKLGAAPDLARMNGLSRGTKSNGMGPLSTRELEVIRLVASGMTNRRIATQLKISEKTVARHVSNIFTKLDLSSRAGATAYAYRNGLV